MSILPDLTTLTTIILNLYLTFFLVGVKDLCVLYAVHFSFAYVLQSQHFNYGVL